MKSATAASKAVTQVQKFASPSSLDPKCEKTSSNVNEIDVMNVLKDPVACDACPEGSIALLDDLVVNGNGEADLKVVLMSPEPTACSDGLNTRS